MLRKEDLGRVGSKRSERIVHCKKSQRAVGVSPKAVQISILVLRPVKCDQAVVSSHIHSLFISEGSFFAIY